MNNNRPETCQQIFHIYLGSHDVDPQKANEILNRLNSLTSAEEIMNTIGMYVGQSVFGKRIAQRILNAKAEIGEFQDLQQIATVPGIGPKRFTTIISALSSPV